MAIRHAFSSEIIRFPALMQDSRDQKLLLLLLARDSTMDVHKELNVAFRHIVDHLKPGHNFVEFLEAVEGRPVGGVCGQKISVYLVDFAVDFFLDATTHLYKRSGPSVRPSVCKSVRPVLFSNDEYGHF